MLDLNSLLAKVRLAPEPLKQRLRPIYFHVFSVARSAPGGRRVAILLADVAPGLHAWLRLRFEAYHVLKLMTPRSPPPRLEGQRLLPPVDLAVTETAVFKRLASRQTAS